MAYISQANLDLIRTQPEKFSYVYSLVATDIRNQLGSEFAGMSDDGFIAAFACQVAYDMKPYGSNDSRTLKDLLAASALDCDNYARLAFHLFRNARPLSNLRWYQVGWDYGAVGNHAQIFVAGANAQLMLDPTVGYIVRAAFDVVTKGTPLSASYVKTLPNSRAIDSSISDFKASVYSALVNGSYSPYDFLYFFDMDKPKMDQQFGNRANWPSPAVEIAGA